MGEDREDPKYLARFNHFLRMLEDYDPSRRWKAAEALARPKDDRAVDPLILAQSDEDWRVRQKAAWALGQIGDKRALIPLRLARLHEHEEVREIIIEALNRIKGSSGKIFQVCAESAFFFKKKLPDFFSQWSERIVRSPTGFNFYK